MQCPQCSQSPLVISERQGLEIDYCTRCRGVWLDRGELDKLIDDFTQTADAAKQKEIMFAIQERVGANQTIIPVFNNPTWYEYSTKRFNGWFSADNPVAKPQVHPDTPERLLHVLSLKPNS